MCPSIDATDEQRNFAAEVLRNLLLHIEIENQAGSDPFLVSHAWTEGPLMYLVYKAPPSDLTWGLVRDTRESLIDPGPWPDVDEAVRYYYLLDLQEPQPSGSFREPGESDHILWDGFPLEDDLPRHPTSIPDEYRYTPTLEASPLQRHRTDHRIVNEPRRYADP